MLPTLIGDRQRCCWIEVSDQRDWADIYDKDAESETIGLLDLAEVSSLCFLPQSGF